MSVGTNVLWNKIQRPVIFIRSHRLPTYVTGDNLDFCSIISFCFGFYSLYLPLSRDDNRLKDVVFFFFTLFILTAQIIVSYILLLLLLFPLYGKLRRVCYNIVCYNSCVLRMVAISATTVPIADLPGFEVRATLDVQS